MGYKEESLSFKYLGVPLSAKTVTIDQCMPLEEKIVERMTCWSAKLLSCAGRVQLIKVVVFGIQTYWAQIFLLPKRIMKMINGLCRVFLWTGNILTSKKKALVVWEKICLPKVAGGLNVMNLSMWNAAAITKQLKRKIVCRSNGFITTT